MVPNQNILVSKFCGPYDLRVINQKSHLLTTWTMRGWKIPKIRFCILTFLWLFFFFNTLIEKCLRQNFFTFFDTICDFLCCGTLNHFFSVHLIAEILKQAYIFWTKWNSTDTIFTGTVRYDSSNNVLKSHAFHTIGKGRRKGSRLNSSEIFQKFPAPPSFLKILLK